MKPFRFGDQVLVEAECVRVIGRAVPGGPNFKQTTSARDYGRFVWHDFAEEPDWPGEAVPLAWHRERPAGFDLTPTASLDRLVSYARLRRLPRDIPEVGLVVGMTRRSEGTILRGAADGDGQLVGPGRTMGLLELALPCGSSKARIILAHAMDLAPAGRRQRAAA